MFHDLNTQQATEPTAMDWAQLCATTFGDLFDLLNTDNLESRRKVDKILYQFLLEAGSLYDDCWNRDVQCDALRFAAEVVYEVVLVRSQPRSWPT